MKNAKIVFHMGKKIFAGARLSTSAWSLTDTNMTLDLGNRQSGGNVLLEKRAGTR